ncbi:probable inactive purple acid phosphatase 16 [Folsomia candida]|uniref:Putative inactive purple acid phosphatase 16 n=1 Tax=Folsomia candida TaxID=158441 RepID=A0A226F1K3_FOLCA|nr:probable inactive purple acid phosphatase 16 [Folsomia candida]OXA63663.1 putative inactive purple acid phosphatase 16 [Folsomia candida]
MGNNYLVLFCLIVVISCEYGVAGGNLGRRNFTQSVVSPTQEPCYRCRFLILQFVSAVCPRLRGAKINVDQLDDIVASDPKIKNMLNNIDSMGGNAVFWMNLAERSKQAKVFIRCPQPVRNADKPKLRFNTNGTFKIVNFADLHYGEYQGLPLGKEQDNNSTRVMQTILRIERPDFVVLTGDLITGEFVFYNPEFYLRKVFNTLEERGFRWASTYGNHDNGFTSTRESIFAVESTFSNSYTQTDGTDDLAGLTNYYLLVYSSNATSNVTNEVETPVLIMWFFDSRGGFDMYGLKPANVDETVVNWFKVENAKMKKKWGIVPALAFFHIPTRQYRAIQATISIRSDCVGLVDEAVVTQDRETGLMDALVNSDTVMTTFVGHDHDNSWCCNHKKMQICYNRHSGYGGYGNWARGARVVNLKEEDITHRLNYVRLENGTIIDAFPKGSESTFKL